MARRGGILSDGIQVEVIGMRELRRALDELGVKVGRKVIRRALSKAAAPVARAARKKIPKGPAEQRSKHGREKPLKQTIATRVVVYGRDNNGAAVVGHRYPEQRHAHLVHEGTDERWRKEPKYFGRAIAAEFGYAGRMPPNPYLRSSLEENKGVCWNILKTELYRGIIAGK